MEKDHSFENPKKGEIYFTDEIEGKKDNWTSNGKIETQKFDSGEEYAYIYNMKEKKWYYKSRYKSTRLDRIINEPLSYIEEKDKIEEHPVWEKHEEEPLSDYKNRMKEYMATN